MRNLLTRFKVCFLTLVACSISQAEVIGEYEGKLVYGQGNVTLAWTDASPGQTAWFECKMVWINPSNAALNIEYNLGQTTNTELVANQRRAGFHKFLVRACNANYCSAWADSSLQGAGYSKLILFWLLPKPIIVVN